MKHRQQQLQPLNRNRNVPKRKNVGIPLILQIVFVHVIVLIVLWQFEEQTPSHNPMDFTERASRNAMPRTLSKETLESTDDWFFVYKLYEYGLGSVLMNMLAKMVYLEET